MKNVIFNIFFIVTLQLFSQEYSKTESGLEFIFHTDIKTPLAKIGDLLSVNMIIKSESDYIIKNTYSEGKPTLFPIKYSLYKADTYEAMRMLSKGDSATFRISSDSLYKNVFKKKLPIQISKGSKSLIIVKCLDINSQKQRLETLVKNNQEEIHKRKSELDNYHEKELAEIKNYLTKNQLNFIKTESDVFVVQIKEGKGNYPTEQNSITIDYKVSLISGIEVENSYTKIKKPFFTLGKSSTIPGLEEGLKLVKEGGYAKIIVPSRLGYSFRGKGNLIPPYSTLIFDVGIISIR